MRLRRRELHREAPDLNVAQRLDDRFVTGVRAAAAVEVAVAQVHRQRNLYPCHRLVDRADTKVDLAGQVAGADLLANRGIGDHQQPGLVELHVVDPELGQLADLLPHDRNAGLHELFPRRVGAGGQLRLPQAPPEDIGRRQSHYRPAGRALQQVLRRFGRQVAVLLDRCRDNGVRHVGAHALLGVQRKPGDVLGEHLHITLTAPFPVGDIVDTGPFLQPDGGRNRIVEQLVRLFVRDPAVLTLLDQLAQPLRARQAADDEGGEGFERVGGGTAAESHYFPLPSVVRSSRWKVPRAGIPHDRRVFSARRQA